MGPLQEEYLIAIAIALAQRVISRAIIVTKIVKIVVAVVVVVGKVIIPPSYPTILRMRMRIRNGWFEV